RCKVDNDLGLGIFVKPNDRLLVPQVIIDGTRHKNISIAAGAQSLHHSRSQKTGPSRHNHSSLVPVHIFFLYSCMGSWQKMLLKIRALNELQQLRLRNHPADLVEHHPRASSPASDFTYFSFPQASASAASKVEGRGRTADRFVG